LTSEDMKI